MIIMLTFFMLSFSKEPKSLDQPVVWKVARHKGRRAGRILFPADPMLLELADNADFSPDWEEKVTADEDGNVRHSVLRNGWAYSEYESDKKQTVLLEGRGFRSIFVNGEPFVGDYYSRGFLRLPIPLKQGGNHFLVKASRGGFFQLRLLSAEESCSISPHDSLLPDLREDALLDSFGAVVILNHTDRLITNAVIEVGDSKVFEQISKDLEPLLPYAVAKPTFHLKQMRQPQADELDEKGRYKLPVTLHHGETSRTIHLSIPLRKAGQNYKATKLSAIDDSVQYYAVRPPIDFDAKRSYALYFTLHGAAVEATGQAAAYSSKHDAFIVAPTNRRPYGFDWQEWGRMDALETLDRFVAEHHIDPKRIYLTGHSMGGHGVWYLGALYPSLFAAICPSAGWISFFSYSRLSRTSESDVDLSPFEWAQLENDTMGLIENYTNLPIYVLHGEKDDNVPVKESRQMVAELEKFHKDFVYHEQPDAGHWWGNQCVDWLPLFEFCRRHVNPAQPLSIKFKTSNPSISDSYAWITVQSQIAPSQFSSVAADADPRNGTVKISTDNVERLKLTLSELLPQDEAKIQIDDSILSVPTKSPCYFLKPTPHFQIGAEQGWMIAEKPTSWLKSSHRNGPFKMAFDKRMVWVYGTSGSDEENNAILAKVRYDAQVWWYRGNGNVTIISDTEFDPDQFTDRNVILYGNVDTNSAFKWLLKDCPIEVARQEVKIGRQSYQGDLGVFFVYPRPESDDNLVGVIGMTSLKATRMCFQARYFTSGVACPDFVVFGQEILSKGMAGILETGYFDSQWKLVDAPHGKPSGFLRSLPFRPVYPNQRLG